METAITIIDKLTVREKAGASVSHLVTALVLIFSFFIPTAYWLGCFDTSLFRNFQAPYRSGPYPAIAAGLVATLILAPVVWVYFTRRIDLLALALAQQGLVCAGYFFLGETSLRRGALSHSILRTSGLVLLFDMAGFATLLAAAGVTYWATGRIRSSHISPPEISREVRFIWVMRATGVFCAGVVLLPMLLTHTIPLLSADPIEARYVLLSTDIGRALYHVGASLLPFAIGALALLIWRKPARLLGFDGILAAGLFGLQLLTANRTPLANSLVVFLSLWTLERRRSRLLVIAAFAGYVFVFTFLSGFSSLLRKGDFGQSRANVVQASLREAFEGENIIDLHDASWVLSQWDYEPLLGTTYLGGLFSMLPSGVFPQKKQWHLGLTAIRIVGFPESHFGLRVGFFAEAFLNFGFGGVIGLALVIGIMCGGLLKRLHLSSSEGRSSLRQNLELTILFEIVLLLSNTSEAYSMWTLIFYLIGLRFFRELHPLPVVEPRPVLIT
jgi:hypothetical protein